MRAILQVAEHEWQAIRSMSPEARNSRTSPWDVEPLWIAPTFVDDPEHGINDVKAIFYDSVPWQGKPTRVFAYYGLPAVGEDEKVPAMVLVHGGGGSASTWWVELWVSRGYAVIAMDTCGCISGNGATENPRDLRGGPPGWGGFDQIDQPIQDQWTFHAVSGVILANSLIRSFPQVDPDRIGVTGISWGGYLVCIAAGLDRRFSLAATVYGCGFLGDNSGLLTESQNMGPEKAGKWLQLWDPSVYLPDVECPMLWVDGSNDPFFPMDSLQKSYRLPGTPRTLCTRVRMPHNGTTEEIHVFADSLLTNGVPLARITGDGRDGASAWTTFQSRAQIVKAELNCTTDTGPWQARCWVTIPAVLDVGAGKASAALPDGVTAYYFNLFDDRDCVVSSEHKELPN